MVKLWTKVGFVDKHLLSVEPASCYRGKPAPLLCESYGSISIKTIQGLKLHSDRLVILRNPGTVMSWEALCTLYALLLLNEDELYKKGKGGRFLRDYLAYVVRKLEAKTLHEINYIRVYNYNPAMCEVKFDHGRFEFDGSLSFVLLAMIYIDGRRRGVWL